MATKSQIIETAKAYGVKATPGAGATAAVVQLKRVQAQMTGRNWIQNATNFGLTANLLDKAAEAAHGDPNVSSYMVQNLRLIGESVRTLAQQPTMDDRVRKASNLLNLTRNMIQTLMDVSQY